MLFKHFDKKSKGTKRALRRFLVPLVLLAISGCADLDTIESSVPNEVRAIRAEREKGPGHARVRELLGPPRFSNDVLRIEAFRKSGTDMVLGVSWVSPYVEPGKHHVYNFLIAYDHNWNVIASSVGTDLLGVRGLRLATTSHGDFPDVLIATRNMSDEALRQKPGDGRCALILLAHRLLIMENVRVDDQTILDLGKASRYGNLGKIFSRHLVPEGRHTMEVVQQSMGGRFQRNFTCASGETLFFSLEGQTRFEQWSWHGLNVEGEIVVSHDVPEQIDSYWQVLSRGDRWYGLALSEYATSLRK